MAISCLNCGSLRPYFPRIRGGVTCLLIESNKGPVLVDTGFGIRDYHEPTRRMHLFLAALRCPRHIKETAVHQIVRFGLEPRDIRHIVMTHLHLDHAGGLPDFPHAEVHLFKREYEYVISGRAGWAYISRHWEFGPRWRPHEFQGESWYDFEAIRLDGFDPELWLVPLVGHTPGHCGVAVQSDEGWILHAGDAVPFNVALEQVPDWISRLVLGRHTPRIREFMRLHSEVRVIGAHMDLAFYANWERGRT